ncbi:unnamed protein product [Acanthoscelides obtectus]|uniref:Ig-like domain-containing protein n=1 Tax=Acanthoscelides obtectus TaxID=200917 RepID=A0A9P0PU89_ACAOB|nr:unnamed protein product [Acanthoscelides obtectus]CAK1675875.1 hypothetical protein AOBTE_LOCUS30457 [Acanthoscelides obtectus]
MWMLLLNLALLLGYTSSFYQRYKYVTGSDAEIVRAHIGTNVSLPCRVDTKQCGQLHSVKWYKDANRVYVLSHAGQGRAEAER